MNAYEQARAEYFLVRAELERIEHEIYEIQQAYRHLLHSTPAEGMTERDIDHEKVSLVYRVSALVEERERWLRAKKVNEKTLQREQDRLFHHHRSQVMQQQHQMEQLEQASTGGQEQTAQIEYADARQQLTDFQRGMIHLSGKAS